MKLDFSNNKDNYLLLYTAGVGGEIITYALSQCVPELNSIPTTDVGKNRWFTICKKDYCRDPNPDTHIYSGEDDPNKSDLYKDHYDSQVLSYWDKDMTVLCFYLTKNFEYWTKIAWYKLKDVESLKEDFVDTHVDQYKKDLTRLNQYVNHFKKTHLINLDDLDKNCLLYTSPSPRD